MKKTHLTKEYLAISKGILGVPNLLNLKSIAMDISNYEQFRPAIQSKDFDKDRQEFNRQCQAFYEFISEALKNDKIFKISRKNPKAEFVMLPADSPAQDELKSNYAEITFVVKL